MAISQVKVGDTTHDITLKGLTVSTDEINTTYPKILSKGEQLVANGNGLMGNNTNFSSWTFDGANANNSAGSFTRASKGTISTNEYFPVNPAKKYRLDIDAKSAKNLSTLYSYLDCYDIDKNQITAGTHIHRTSSTTTLAKDLKSGDTVAYLTDVSGWSPDMSHGYYMILWNYTNSKGYTYPAGTYSRNRVVLPSSSNKLPSSAINTTNKTITLKSAYSGATIPAGTPVSQGGDGSTYKYIGAVNSTVPIDWTTYTGYMDGVDLTGTNAGSKFPPATAFCRVGFLWNYNGASDQLWITNVSVTCNVTSEEINTRAPINHASTGTSYGVSTASAYGHAKASSTSPKANGTANVGSETSSFARGDHIHPAQTSVSGNAGTATKFSSARTIELTGDVTGSASTDGSSGWSITATVADDSHNHIISNIDGLQDALNAKATKDVAVAGGNNGLMSGTDKTRVDSMWNVWSSDGTNDTLVNKVQEVLKVFEDYPEGDSVAEALAGKANATHNQASSTINAMTGYSKPSSTSAITTADTLNSAIGKLEKALDGKQASGSYVEKSGGTMNDGATLKFSTYGTRSVTISGNSISADMSKETGGWAGAFASVKDPSNTTTTMLGWYGGASGLTHIFMGGTYSDPAMKMTPAGQFTFKNTPKVGTTDVALKTDIPTVSYPVTSVAGKTGAVTLAKGDVGLGNVENKSSATIRGELTKANVTTALGYTPPTENTTYSAATTSAAGLMSAADKTKLDGIASNANNFSLPYRLAANQASGTGSVSDPNNALETGFYYVTSGTTNRPPFSQSSNTDYRLLVTAYGSTWLQQIATDFRCDDIFYRRKENGTWKPWVKIYPIDEATTSAKGLMSSTDKTKLDGIATGANKTTVDTALSSSSTNPVQNKVINTALNNKLTANGWSTSEGGYLRYYDGSDKEVVYRKDGITYSRDASGTTSQLNFPENKSGTFALTSDIPASFSASADCPNGSVYIGNSQNILLQGNNGVQVTTNMDGSVIYVSGSGTSSGSGSGGTDTNTTYDLSASKNSTNGNAKINLIAGGSGSGTDSVTIKGTGGTTVTTDANGVVTINSSTTSSSGSTVSSEMPLISYTGTSYDWYEPFLEEGNTMYINLKKIGGGAFQLGDRLELCALRYSIRSPKEQNSGERRYRLRALCTQDITQDIIDNPDANISFAIVGGTKGANYLFHNDRTSGGAYSTIHIRVKRPIYAANGNEYNAKFSNLITLEKSYSVENNKMVIK